MYLETFDHLPQEKRERIINAAMGVFALHGYHKASASDIAKAAKISKAMIFTYFGSKSGCYAFLCDEMVRVMLAEFNKVKDQLLAVTDYFERVILSAQIKVGVMKQYPALLSFATSVFSERDATVRPIIDKLFAEAYQLRELFLSTGIDAAKFKNPADAARVGKMAVWMSKGCADEWSRCGSDVLDNILTDFVDCMVTLKKYFYKEAHR